MIQRINKQLSILRRVIKQSKELERIRSMNVPSLNAFANAFEQVKRSSYTRSDIDAFQRQEDYTKQLSANSNMVSYAIFGNHSPRAVKDIYRKAASPSIWCQFLYCLCKNLEAHKVFEIGCNLGVSGGYILEAVKDHPDHKFITMEGVADLVKIAGKHFSDITTSEHFEIVEGLYQDTYPGILKKEIEFDLLFIDGNHQKEATIHYFNTLKSKQSNKAIMIFDDINWTKGMKECWQIIKSDPSVAYSIDMYKQGIIILGDGKQTKSHHFELHLAY